MRVHGPSAGQTFEIAHVPPGWSADETDADRQSRKVALNLVMVELPSEARSRLTTFAPK